MASSICAGLINACRIRLTRLNSDGTVADQPNNSYVSDALVQMVVTPVEVAAVEKSVLNGCGCECLGHTTPAYIKRFDATIDLCVWDPQLMEMLTGADLVLNGSEDPIGWMYAYAAQCGDQVIPAVAVETWSTRKIGGATVTPGQYEQILIPGLNFTLAPYTLGADFAVPSFVGTGFANTEWGEGPYGDQPQADNGIGGAWETDSVPTADCAYADVSLT
jgi:hypothetical protein